MAFYENTIVARQDLAEKEIVAIKEKYNEIIKNNIGLRLQSKLTKEQAKFVAACNSVHKDISLNF